jgi:hypothetical protein
VIIAVDFDDTIRIGKEPNIPLISRLRQMQSQGVTIILWTCREGNRLREAVQYCRGHGLQPNYVNCNPPEVIRRFGYDPRKIYADVYIDDKSMK